MKRVIFLACLLFTTPASAAVVLVYHHVSNDTPASTSVTPESFEAHLTYLAENDFKVLPLTEILNTLRRGKPLPANTVAITFDDAYQSVHDTAMPLLAKRGWPYTVFVNTEATSRTSSLYMDWEDLRRVLNNGGDVQNHSHSHDSLAFTKPGESEAQWQKRVRSDIGRAQTLIKDNLGIEPSLIAYPYGEYSEPLQSLVAELGLMGLGQHSGAIGVESDFLGLPRHPFYKGADSIERFATRVRTQPLAMTAQPRGPIKVNTQSNITLTLEGDLDGVNCFFDGNTVAINNDSISNLGPFTKRRTKLNCTKSLGSGVYQWWSYLFIKP